VEVTVPFVLLIAQEVTGDILEDRIVAEGEGLVAAEEDDVGQRYLE